MGCLKMSDETFTKALPSGCFALVGVGLGIYASITSEIATAIWAPNFILLLPSIFLALSSDNPKYQSVGKGLITLGAIEGVALAIAGGIADQLSMMIGGLGVCAMMLVFHLQKNRIMSRNQ